MKKQNQKSEEALEDFELYPEDSYPEHYTSPNVGKPKPWHVRGFKAARHAVYGFVLDVIAAVKEITRRVL